MIGCSISRVIPENLSEVNGVTHTHARTYTRLLVVNVPGEVAEDAVLWFDQLI